MRRQLQGQLTISFKNNLKNWWVNVIEELEVATASVNSLGPFKPMHNTGVWRTLVSGVVCDRIREHIHGKQKGLDLQDEHFKDQFNRPHASELRRTSAAVNTCEVSLDPLTQIESKLNVRLLKIGEAAGLVEHSKVVFKSSREPLLNSVTQVICDIWNKERISSSRNESLILPNFKKDTTSDCCNHRRVSSISTITKVLVSIELCRLTSVRGIDTRKNQAQFCSGQDCIDQVFVPAVTRNAPQIPQF